LSEKPEDNDAKKIAQNIIRQMRTKSMSLKGVKLNVAGNGIYTLASNGYS